jgi:phage major head subunit gpT-like protein
MSLITPATLAALKTTINRQFMSVLEEVQPFSDRFYTKVSSSNLLETYAWLADLPAMREWLGAREVQNARERAFQITNKHYEATVAVGRKSIEDGNLASTEMLTGQLAYQARRLPDDLLIDLLRNGQSRTCYDGQNFFDTDHPTDIDNVTGTQSNYSASGMALSNTNYQTVRAAMMQFAGENGRPRGTSGRRFALAVPPQLEKTGREILTAELITTVYGSQTAAAAMTNVLKDSADLVVLPELGVDATTWYLLVLDGPLKPFILQERQAPRLITKMSPEDENVFWRDEYVMGIDARYGAGYGAWFLAYKAVA